MRATGDNFARNLARLRACMAAADRAYTPAELQAAELALSDNPTSPQRSLFSVAPSRESCPGDKPSLAAGGTESSN